MSKKQLIPRRLSEKDLKNRLSPLFEEEGLCLVILFGSFASGRTHKKSDIDLAFLFDDPVDILDLTNRVIRLLHTDNIDIIDLRRTNPLLRFVALNKGKLLFERRPGMFNGFFSLVFRMYIDTKKLRDARETSIKHFLKERDLG
jgi:predicted nucleotidyltransferase